MNFLWCDAYYSGNELFRFVKPVLAISLLFTMILIFIKLYKWLKKKIKNKFLRVLIGVICFILFLVLNLFVLALILVFSEIFSNYNSASDEWLFGGNHGGSYEDHRYVFLFTYVVMWTSLLLNFCLIYYQIIKRRLSVLRDKIKQKEVKKSCFWSGIVIAFLIICFAAGQYMIIDPKAPDYDTYSTEC